MTIRKKIFYSNSFMVLASLLILLAIGGGMVALFKDEFLNWYGGVSRLAPEHYAVNEALPELMTLGTDWEAWEKELSRYDFRLVVTDDGGQEIFSNVNEHEREGVEAVLNLEKKEGQTDTYLVEGVTVLAAAYAADGGNYVLYLVSRTTENPVLNMDRGMFEMFLIAFLVVGVLAVACILFCSQLFTKFLIGKILQPVRELQAAAERVADGNLAQPIAHKEKDEFLPVCDSFDLMQKSLKEGMEKNAAYERARTEMVSGISHDLRTPLTSVKGYIKGMLDGVANTEEKRREYLEIAYRKSCSMEALLSKLFYFSRLETGNMPFFMQRIDMESFFLRFTAEKRQELAEKNAQLLLEKETPDAVFCMADVEQLRRVFDNLVENSLKYAAVQPGETGRETLCMTIRLTQGENLEIDFSDNGAGVPDEKLPHIFEQFYRGDEARNSKCDGNGLGLYVCESIIRQHGGKIRAYNEGGLHIQMELPKLPLEI